jgi:hypothetical protein
VKTIGVHAFEECENLSSISFESGSKLQKIGGKAFAYCAKLKKITIPKNVKEIGTEAFEECESLSSVTFQSGSKLQKIGEMAFSECYKIKTIIFTSKVIKSIGEDAIVDISEKAVIQVPKSALKTYQKLLNKKAGYVKSMKIKSKS